MSLVLVSGHWLIDYIKVLAFTLVAFVVFGSTEASERVVKGQIHGIDINEGVWVGVVTGEPSSRNYPLRIPHDDFESDDLPETNRNWVYSQTGEFEISSEVEEDAVLLIVAKNRVPIEIAWHSGFEEKPIEASVLRGVSFKGIVTAENGKHLQGATISVSSRDKKHDIPSFAKPRWISGTDGSFVLAGLEEHNSYTIGVTADGYAPLILPGLRISEESGNPLELQLHEGYFVSGKVVGRDGEHLSGIKVFASWNRDAVRIVESQGRLEVKRGGWNEYRTGAKTESDGSFRIGPLAKGTTGRLYVGSESTGSAITQEISAPYDDLVLRLSQESVRGRVLDGTSGAPIENFTVSMRIGESRSHTIESSDGVFNIPIFPIDKDGTKIRIYAPDYGHWTRELFGGSSGEYDIGDVTLERQRTIRGVVRDGRTGSPMAGVRLFGFYDHLTSFAVSDVDGAFTLDRLDNRVSRLTLLVPRTAYASVDIPAGIEEFDIDLHLDGVLEGSLILPDGTPVTGVVEIDGSDWMFSRKLSSEGAFRWEGLAPGTYTLTAETDAGLVESRTVTLKANERVSEIELVVEPGLTASGSISGLKGIERVEITVRDSDSQVLLRKHFANGSYAIHGLPSNVTIVAHASNGLTFIREFLDENETGRAVDFHFEDESRLSGWLTSGEKPLGGVSLQIKPENSNAVIANVTTTESGRYEAHGLSEGRHVIHIDAGHTFEVDIGRHTMFDIALPENTLHGLVRGDKTRLPVGGGSVRLLRANTPEGQQPIEVSGRVGSDGTFLFQGLVAGNYDVLVEHPYAETASSRVYVSGIETVEMAVPCANTRECIEGPPN